MSDIALTVANDARAAKVLLEALAEDLAGDEQAQHDLIEGETHLLEAIEAAVDRIAELDALQAALKAREENHAARRKRFADQQARIKRAIAEALDMTGQRKLNLATATVYTSPGKARPIITDKAAIPEIFTVPQPPEPNLQAIKEALLEGAEIPGATLSNPSIILNIRTR